MTDRARISDADVAAFEKDGVVCLRGLFEGDWMDVVARGIERELADPGPGFVDQQEAGQPGRFVTDYCASQQIQEIQRFVLDSPAAGTVARLMRSRSAGFLMDVLWIKEPGTDKPTAWHQDQPYFPLDGEKFCSIWLPVDPVDTDTCLHFIRGSHRWGRWFSPRLTKAGERLYDPDAEASGFQFEEIPDFDAELDRHEVLCWDMQPGDCLVFHGLAVHGGPGNRSASRRRRALSTVWFGDGARWGIRPSPPRPNFSGHGLTPGDPIDSPLFPRLWPPGPEGAGAERFSPNSELSFTL